MGRVLHGSATTTEAIRRAIQNSQESLRTLAKRYGINLALERLGISVIPDRTPLRFRRWSPRRQLGKEFPW